MESGLDPDKALPEDILLLQKDDHGSLIVLTECSEARKRAGFHNNHKAEDDG